MLERLGPVVRAIAQDERSQLRNRELATDRIVEQLREATKVRRPRRATKPTAAVARAAARRQAAPVADEAAPRARRTTETRASQRHPREKDPGWPARAAALGVGHPGTEGGRMAAPGGVQHRGSLQKRAPSASPCAETHAKALLSRRIALDMPPRKRGYSTVTVFARLRGWSTLQAAQARDPVREQLQRQRREHGLEERRRLRHVDHVVRVVLDVLVALGRDRDHVRARGRGTPGCSRRSCRRRGCSSPRTTTGVPSSSSAIGPCFISPAE